MPTWLVSILKTVASLFVPELVKQGLAALRDLIQEIIIKRQTSKNKKKAEKYEADKSKSNADDLIDGL